MSEIIAKKQESVTEKVRFGNHEFDVTVNSITKVDTFKVGDPVKILKKKTDYSNEEMFPGVIVGFDNFESVKAIQVMALKSSYSSVDIEFIVITEKDEKYEFIAYDGISSMFEKENIVQKFDRMIQTTQMELSTLEEKRSYFLQGFGAAFDKIRNANIHEL